mmetsp:Transcript_66341/g.152015  ORF Transcript_66341/g.152015 Transcript_66341/m.152015 type:complete len:210 (+) Transcript_66341:1067-1696(+)
MNAEVIKITRTVLVVVASDARLPLALSFSGRVTWTIWAMNRHWSVAGRLKCATKVWRIVSLSCSRRSASSLSDWTVRDETRRVSLLRTRKCSEIFRASALKKKDSSSSGNPAMITSFPRAAELEHASDPRRCCCAVVVGTFSAPAEVRVDISTTRISTSVCAMCCMSGRPASSPEYPKISSSPRRVTTTASSSSFLFLICTCTMPLATR